ncbi:MAG: polysaccharide deacetylase family protein [Alphaproteobacteria bacterium]|nr:polysaccharide deacetylase family protein [Alphaproteobacteria bacterium]MBV9695250.1 polysaccharide deacetylase family protein [Alphaproteobacteria bacterium]
MLPASWMRALSTPAAVFFHGVERRLDDVRVQGMHHARERFCDIAGQLARDFEVLPLCALEDVLKNPRQHRRSLFLMADDGYVNNLTEAEPILRAHGLPWTVFVSARHIETAARNPLFLARLFLLFAPPGLYRVENLGNIEISLDRNAADIGARLSQLKRLPAEASQAAIESMRSQFLELDTEAARFVSDSFLTWDQVAALKSRGVEIGAHADRHWAMHEGQSPAYLREQASGARAMIESRIGSCRHFAYPFGNVGDVSRAAWHAVRDAGFDYGFTTLSGTLDASLNRWLLPRYGLRPCERRLASLVPTLRLGNPRLRAFQRSLT